SLRIKTIAAAGTEPIGIGDALIATRLAWTTPGTVVLQSAIHVIRPAHVYGNRVELGCHDAGVDEFPRVSLIISDIEAAVISDQDVLAILWIYPNRVVVTVCDSGLQ